MPTYALLGATGATGSAVLRNLLEQPPKYLRLRILVRNKPKLMKSFPNLESSPPFPISVNEGSLSDGVALRTCLEGANAILQCVGSNQSRPGTTITFDTTASIIQALRDLREAQGNKYITPTILQLRAAPMNKALAAHESWITSWIVGFLMWFCLGYVFADHKRATELLESTVAETPGLLEYIFLDPPGTMDPDGTTPTGYQLVITEKMGMGISFADLGVAICEVAERRDAFRGKGVGMYGTGEINMTWQLNVRYLIDGAKARVLGWVR